MATWNPDDGTALTSQAISIGAGVEKTSLALWEEFLSGWFDGTQHMLRGAYVTLPKIDQISFQDAALPSQDGLYLTVTTERPMSVKRQLWNSTFWMITERARVSFWFRALVKAPRHDGHNSHSLVRWGADSLFAILESEVLTVPLQRKGMGIIRPQPPVLIGAQGAAGAARMLPLDVRYIYSNQETADVAAVLDSDLAGNIIYLGRKKELRITSNGLERKAADGKWYVIDVENLPVDGGTTPALTVYENES